MLDRMEGDDTMSKQRAATISVNNSEHKVYVEKEGNRDAESFHFYPTSASLLQGQLSRLLHAHSHISL